MRIRAIKAAYPRYGLRSTDVILAAFPKTGSTWVRFILANIVSLAELDGGDVDYAVLNGPLASEYDPHRYPTVEYSVIPRFVKTHMNYSRRRFGKNRVMYVYRNPADTMVSFFEYMRNRRDELRYRGTFEAFIRDTEYGLDAWCRHVAGWRPATDVVIGYESLKSDGVGAISTALDRLGVVGVPEETVREALRRSSFSAVREMEENKGLDARAQEHLAPGFRFARKGTVGQWKEYFAEEDLRYLRETLDRHGLGDIELPDRVEASRG